ncbi:MAG: hypothetical protein WC803_04145 [Sphingomonas sp.]|jgi:hypothetical protein
MTKRLVSSKRPVVIRWLLMGIGAVLIAMSPFVGIIPGPGGIPVFVFGLVLLLRNSALARRWFVRAVRRWPRLGKIADMGLRRASVKRRRERDAQRAGGQADDAPQG